MFVNLVLMKNLKVEQNKANVCHVLPRKSGGECAQYTCMIFVSATQKLLRFCDVCDRQRSLHDIRRPGHRDHEAE